MLKPRNPAKAGIPTSSKMLMIVIRPAVLRLCFFLRNGIFSEAVFNSRRNHSFDPFNLRSCAAYRLLKGKLTKEHSRRSATDFHFDGSPSCSRVKASPITRRVYKSVKNPKIEAALGDIFETLRLVIARTTQVPTVLHTVEMVSSNMSSI